MPIVVKRPAKGRKCGRYLLFCSLFLHRWQSDALLGQAIGTSLWLSTNPPDEASNLQIRQKAPCEKHPEQSPMAHIVTIDAGKGEQVRTGVDDPGNSGACSFVMLIHYVADHGVPATIRVTKEFHWLAHAFFDLGLTLGYFLLGLDKRQSGEDRMVYAMGAETESLPGQFCHLLPIE